jgi:hypothetical protein
MNLPQRHRATGTERGGDKGKRREGDKKQDCPIPLVSAPLWLCVSASSLICLMDSAAAHDLFLKFDSFFLEPNTKTTVRLMNGYFFIHMTKLKQADLDYESKWASLTFEIR